MLCAKAVFALKGTVNSLRASLGGPEEPGVDLCGEETAFGSNGGPDSQRHRSRLHLADQQCADRSRAVHATKSRHETG